MHCLEIHRYVQFSYLKCFKKVCTKLLSHCLHMRQHVLTYLVMYLLSDSNELGYGIQFYMN